MRKRFTGAWEPRPASGVASVPWSVGERTMVGVLDSKVTWDGRGVF
jgi:hypothetical protein